MLLPALCCFPLLVGEQSACIDIGALMCSPCCTSPGNLVGSSGLGGPRPLLPHALDAGARAQAAARSVPSPPRDPLRPPKRKRVSWVPEGRLVAVRWFLKVPLSFMWGCCLWHAGLISSGAVHMQDAVTPLRITSAALCAHRGARLCFCKGRFIWSARCAVALSQSAHLQTVAIRGLRLHA